VSRRRVARVGDGVEERSAGRDAGAADYLGEPFKHAELLACTPSGAPAMPRVRVAHR